MGSRLDTLRHTFTVAFFLVIFATVLAHHGSAAEVAFLLLIAAVVVGLPMAQDAWSRRKLRIEGERLARELAGEGRMAPGAYELRIGGRVARFWTKKVDGNRTTVVTVDTASPHFGLNVVHESATTRAEFGRGTAMDIEIGHPVLDPALAIEGGPLAAVRSILTDPRVTPSLLELADRKTLRITARDGLVRVLLGAGDRNEAVVQLALGISVASLEHAATAPDARGDGDWEQFQMLEERRAERKEQLTAWVAQSLATFCAVMMAIKTGGAANMKMNLGPIEILALILMSVGLPHYTAATIGTAGVAWFGFAIPAVVRFSKLGHGQMQRGANPVWSFMLAPILLLSLVATYKAEANAPVKATAPTKPPASLASTHAKAKPKALNGVLHDTEGRAFKFTCPKGGTKVDACTVTGATADVVPQSKPQSLGRTPSFGLKEGALVSVCDGVEDSNGLTAGPSGCRPVTCSVSDDCPHSDRETAATICSHGLCESISGKLTSTDVQALCSAGVGVALEGPDVDARNALAKKACPGIPCAIAPECKQP